MSYKFFRRFISLMLALVITLAGYSPALADQPLNDSFADAIEINSLPFSATVDNTEAGLELDEPQQCAGTYNTIWYVFTPAESMLILADTQGSTISANINIYRAVDSGFAGLQPVTCTRYYDGAFLAEGGVTYYLQAGGQDPVTGTIQVNLKEVFAPANDDFSAAEELTALPFTSTVDFSGAGIESGEAFGCNSTERTVWYSFIPTQTTLVGVDTEGSAVNAMINVFSAAGTEFSDLTSIKCSSFNFATSFVAVAGQSYYLQIGSNEVGTMQVNVNELFPPSNDDFATPEEITSLPHGSTVDLTDARTEPDEPLSWCTLMDRTVWYSFTPIESTIVRADTQGSAINGNLNIYRLDGSDINGLSVLWCTASNGPYTFVAEAGQKYYFQAGGVDGEVGSMKINLEEIASIGNDDFASATVIPSPLPFDDTVDTLLTTREANEPSPSCAYYGPGVKSVWYAFTPTTNGLVSASIPAASFSAVIAAYTGSSLNGLTEIGCQAQYYPEGNLLTLQMNAGTTYYFQIGNFYSWEQGGSLQFHLDVPPPPAASFYFYPSNPSAFDTIQFLDQSYDPAQLGFQSFAWGFGDGTTSTDQAPAHKYASDGDYTVEYSVITTDGRTASTSQVVQVRTHDVSLTKVEAPESAKVGKSEKITVSIINTSPYAESVRVDLYRSVSGGGFEFVATLTKNSASNPKGDKPTKFAFNYIFTNDDASIGKVIFRAVAMIENAPDAFTQDNERLSSLTIVKKKK